MISQTEAAQLRGVTRAAISDLIKRGKLQAIVVAGRPLLKRSDVLSYKPESGGWPKGKSRKAKAQKQWSKKGGKK